MSRTTAVPKSTAQHSFAQIPMMNHPRSVFNRSCNVKGTMDAGYLYPIFVDEALPGDTIDITTTLFARLNTLIFPLMDNSRITIHFFSCANRLLWTNWKRMMGEQDNPADSVSYQVPIVTSPIGGFPRLSIWDYMGVPPLATGAAAHSVSALHSRMYGLLWNQWYRDENLQNSTTVDQGDGPDVSTNYPLLQRGKPKDYFAGALPFAQKGTAVSIPLGTSAPVMGIGFNANTGAVSAGLAVRQSSGTTPTIPFSVDMGDAATVAAMAVGVKTNSVSAFPDIYADLSTATAATINALRTANQVQIQYELEARGGTRYTELLRVAFGVVSPDARQQRVEFLGGGVIDISVNAVPSTYNQVGGTDRAQGSLAGYGAAMGRLPRIYKSFTEHSCIMGIISISADVTYQQGANRMWHRLTKYDYFWPAFSHLGEQAIESREIYIDGTGSLATQTGDWSIWGYQERYGEYRYKPSYVVGKLRTSDPLTLDSWHLALSFGARPLLNSTFIPDQPPFARVIATVGEPAFMFDCHFDFKHVRPMPTYGVPGSSLTL